MCKLGINKLANVSTILNSLKPKVDDLDIGKLKTVPVGDVVYNEVVKKNKIEHTKDKSK